MRACVCACVRATAATLREFGHYITQILSLVVPSDSKHTQSCVFRSKWDYMPTDVSSDTMLYVCNNVCVCMCVIAVEVQSTVVPALLTVPNIRQSKKRVVSYRMFK